MPPAERTVNMDIPNITYVCPDCGSEEINIDASTYWDKETQEWTPSEIYENRANCEGCGNIGITAEKHEIPKPIEPHLILLMEAMDALEVAGAALGHVPTPDSPDPDHPVNRYLNLGGEGYNAYDMARSKAIDINRYLKAHEAGRHRS